VGTRAHARDLLPDRVVGITGSVGKTTVKDLVAGGLSAAMATHATRASFNNELGVPSPSSAPPTGSRRWSSNWAPGSPVTSPACAS